jgi:hypothetical protein
MSRGSKPGERRGGRLKGTPNKASAEIKALAAGHAPAIIKELARLATKAKNEATRVAAGNSLLDRAFGKAPQAITGAGGQGPVLVQQTIDAPPDETREQWIARRTREIAASGAVVPSATHQGTQARAAPTGCECLK